MTKLIQTYLYVVPMNTDLYWIQERTDDTLQIATTDIHNEFLLERIRVENNCRVIPQEYPEEFIRKMKRRENQNSAAIINDICHQKKSIVADSSWESEPIINLVDSLLEEALRQSATDIHLEPTTNRFRIRFRKDGMLEDYRTLPDWIADPCLIRLKLLAQVDITERRLPLDGSFTFLGGGSETNIRLSTIPIQHRNQASEKCVLRLLPSQDEGLTLSSLQISPTTLTALRNAFKAPQGILLITGPTGSGKTTTLYAGLREIIPNKINITTIEDPVEYKLDGANQVQINNRCGFSFAQALRSILRQDPDVILIGEIRDSETAKIAIQAAQTGHLVLATLHTNDAKGACSRLEDLGVSLIQIKESLLGVVSQRLLRRCIRTENGNQTYAGRIGAMEFLLPNGDYADGSIQEYASRLVQEGITDLAEVQRVLGI